MTVASFTAAGLKVLGRGCARGGGTAAAEACLYDRVCSVARRVSGAGFSGVEIVRTKALPHPASFCLLAVGVRSARAAERLGGCSCWCCLSLRSPFRHAPGGKWGAHTAGNRAGQTYGYLRLPASYRENACS